MTQRITVKIGQLSGILSHAILHNLNLIIVGKPGLGKTEITRQSVGKLESDILTSGAHGSRAFVNLCERVKNAGSMPLFEMHLAGMDDIDIMGIYYQGAFQLNGVIDSLHSWCSEKNHVGVALLDDGAQADFELQKKIMQVHRGRINSFEFPRDNVRWILATNDFEHAAKVKGLLEPFKDYFHAIIYVDADPQAWCKWAAENRLHPFTIWFINQHPDMLSADDYSTSLSMNVSPRGWEKVSDIHLSEPGEESWEKALVYGRLGHAIGSVYWSELSLMRQSIDPVQILENPRTCDISPLDKNPILMYSVCNAMTRFTNDTNVGNAFAFMERIPREFQSVFVKSLEAHDPTLLQCQEYTIWLQRMAQYRAGV